MSSISEHSKREKRRIWPWILLLISVCLVIGARLSLNTDYVREAVKNRLAEAANEQLTVELRVGALKGDLWKEAIVEDIVLGRTDTLASIGQVELHYNIWSYFGPQLQVSLARVRRPFVKLRESGGEWNVMRWLKYDTTDTSRSLAPFPFEIENFTLEGGRVDAVIQQLPGDSALTVDSLQLGSRLAMTPDSYDATIRELSFKVLNSRLGSPLTVESRFHADGSKVTLQKFVAATGQTLLQSSGSVKMDDSTASLNIRAEPVAWEDIASVTDRMPVKKDLALSLDLQGSFSKFHMGLNMEGGGLEQFHLETEMEWDSLVTFTGARITANRIDLPVLLEDKSLPTVRELDVRADGAISPGRYEEAEMQVKVSAGTVEYPPYRLDRLRGSFSTYGGSGEGTLALYRASQEIHATVNINDVWSAAPGFAARAEGKNIDPSYWLQDRRLKGRLAVEGNINGRGLTFSQRPWSYEVTAEGKGEGAFKNMHRLDISGTLREDKITGKGRLRTGEGTVEGTAEVGNYQSVPEFSYRLTADSLNLREFRGMEKLSTDISLVVEGEGKGASLETLQLASSIQMDSSVVNREFIEKLTADITVEDTVARIRSASLLSSIADGSISARLHLLDLYDPDNQLDLDLEIKEVESLAPLAGIEKLQAEGSVEGRLSPLNGGRLKFSGRLNLRDLRYGDTFAAEEVKGSTEIFMEEDPEYEVDLELNEPVFSSVRFQDVFLQTNGAVDGRQARGSFSLKFTSSADGEMIQSGRYRISPDSTTITTNAYMLNSSQRSLSLVDPFEVRIEGSSFRMDTMKLASEDGAALELAVPYADSTRQQGYLMGKDLNLTVIQNTLLNRSYFEGVLSGRLQVHNADTVLRASGNLLLADLAYRETRLDSLRMSLSVEDKLVDASLVARDNGKKLVSGNLHLPIEAGYPGDFDEAFYEKELRGSLTVNEVALHRFDELLSDAGILNTRGNLNMNVILEGTAGNPELSGEMKLDEATISGVKVDSVNGSLNYQHEKSQVTFSMSVSSLKQKAAELRGEVPFGVDLKNFDLSLPGKRDSITVDVETHNFNLAALNDFVNRQRLRNVKGTINGMIHVMGRVDDLDARGKMVLSKGAVHLVRSGITADKINATLLFEPGTLNISAFEATSGSGRLTGEGRITIEKLMPGTLDITLKARNFTAADTEDHKAVINLDSNITGTFSRPNVTGDLSIRNGFVRLDNFGEKSVETIELETEEGAGLEDFSVYDSLALDVDISFGRRFFIRNRRYLEMSVELEGDLDLLKKEAEELQVFGTLSAVSGYARPLGKRFELEEGVLSFSASPDNPQLNIRTLYEPPQPKEKIRIWYVIEGNVEDPKFRYESDPPMELENIISYTLFGQPFYSLDSWKQVVASSGSNASASDLALEILLDRVETLATRRLGIDVVKIDHTRVGGDTGTSITTGWYLNPKVFFAIQNVITGSTPDTGFLLEYSLRENLKLILSQGNESRQGIDLKWNYDY